MTTIGQSLNPPSRKFWTTKPFLISAAVVLLGGGLWGLLKDSTTLSFSFLLDGKPLPVGMLPKIELDGRAFTSGLTVAPGPHKLTADLQNAEPFEQRVWVFYGNKDLGPLALASSKGSLLVVVSPSPASVTVRQGLESVSTGFAPLTVEKLVPGSYELEVKRGEYRESHSVKVLGRQHTEKKIDLNLGGVNLSSDPVDAEFELSGNGQVWSGKLPARLEEVPVGDYRLSAMRKGWELDADVAVTRGTTATGRIEFPYGSIEVSSAPSGMAVSMNGIEVGKTPLLLKEIKPARYALLATDGTNDLTTEIDVGPKEAAKHAFAFRYGAVQLSSTPANATVIRKGKELGKTPLILERITAGEIDVEFRLQGYEAVRHSIQVVEGEATKFAAKLFSEQYVQAMKRARDAFDASQFSASQIFLNTALEYEPGDPVALQLQDEIPKATARAAEALRIERANARARELAALTWLDFGKVVADCTDTKQVQYPVQVDVGYYEEYRDEKGKVRRRFRKTGERTEMRTRTESTFNHSTFSKNYRGRMFGFNCPDRWAVVKIEKDGSIVLKAGGMGSAEIKATAPANNPDGLRLAQKGQKVSLKGVLVRYEAGFLSFGTLHMENAEILENFRETVP